jgi:hypothetical protein
LGVVCIGKRGGGFPTGRYVFGLASVAFLVCGKDEECFLPMDVLFGLTSVAFR